MPGEVLRGTVVLAESILKNDNPAGTDASSKKKDNAALYVTARPNVADNVPRAILDGTRGKPPPVLVARFSSVAQFPYEFVLTTNDVTLEGNSNSRDQETMAMEGPGVANDVGGGDTSTSPSYLPYFYWWRNDPLVVSARWDSDGVAATRDPEDLVGRAAAPAIGTAVKATSAAASDASPAPAVVVIELQGRGAAGKLFTSKRLW